MIGSGGRLSAPSEAVLQGQENRLDITGEKWIGGKRGWLGPPLLITSIPDKVRDWRWLWEKGKLEKNSEGLKRLLREFGWGHDEGGHHWWGWDLALIVVPVLMAWKCLQEQTVVNASTGATGTVHKKDSTEFKEQMVHGHQQVKY